MVRGQLALALLDGWSPPVLLTSVTSDDGPRREPDDFRVGCGALRVRAHGLTFVSASPTFT